MATEVSGPAVFSGSDETADLTSPAIDFGAAEKSEIKTALETFKSYRLNAYDVNAAMFPLPNLGSRLNAIAENLHKGSGFSLLRGFNTGDYTHEDNLIIFLGLASYVGPQRGAQNKDRVMVQHITAAKEWEGVPPEQRHGIHTNVALPFHADMGCEILALFYRQVAASGGVTSLASTAAIYNDLLKQPEILQTLEAADWSVQFNRRNNLFKEMPLLAYHDGHVIISGDPGRLGLDLATGKKPTEGCRLKEAQLKALEVLNELAEKHAVPIQAQAGDILFINNLGVLHKRGSYVDADEEDAQAGEDGNKRRWLMRLWLRNESMSWEIPQAMKSPWESIYGKAPRRLIQDKYHPEPEPNYKIPLYTSGTAAWLIEDDAE